MDDRTETTRPDIAGTPDLPGQPNGRSNDIGLSVTLQPPEFFERNDSEQSVARTAYGKDFVFTTSFSNTSGAAEQTFTSTKTGKTLNRFGANNHQGRITTNLLCFFTATNGSSTSADNEEKLGLVATDDIASIDDFLDKDGKIQYGWNAITRANVRKAFETRLKKAGKDFFTRKELRTMNSEILAYIDRPISIENGWLVFENTDSSIHAYQIADQNDNFFTDKNPTTDSKEISVNTNSVPQSVKIRQRTIGTSSTVKDQVEDFSDPLRHFPWLTKYCGPNAGEKIGNNTVSCKAGTITIFDTSSKQPLFSDSAVGYSMDAANPNILYYVGLNGELKKIEIDKIGASTPVEAKPLPVTGAMKEFTMDARGNFFLVLVGEQLFIIEKTTLKVAQKIENVRGNIHSDASGKIFFVDTDNRLRVANTTFAIFEKGGVDRAREAARAKLEKTMATLDQGLQISGLAGNPKALSRESVLARLKREMEGAFGPLLDRAKTSEEVETIAARLTEFKEGDQFKDFPEAFILLDNKVVEKGSALKSSEFAAEIAGAENTLRGIDTAQAAMRIDAMINPLTQKRTSLSILDLPQRRAIDESLAKLKEKAGEVKTRFAGEIIRHAESLVREIERMINGPDAPVSLEELAAIKGSDKVRDFERALTYIADPEQSRALKSRYTKAHTDKFIALKRAAADAAAKERNALALLIDDAGRVLLDLEEEIDETTFNDVKGFKRWIGRNQLVPRFREIILGLPDTLRKEQEDKLEALINKKTGEIERRKVVDTKTVAGEVTFAGGFQLPVFKETPAVWQAKFIPLNPEGEGTGEYGELVFEDTHGKIFNPKIGTVKMDPNDPDTKAVIDAYMASAKRFFDRIKGRQVPHAGDNFRDTEHHRAKVAELAQNLRPQIKYHMGMVIIEGEAGVGKNMGIDTLAEALNYETFTFACNGQTEKEDMTFTYEYDPARGTYRLNAKFLEALQTPGMIVILDEINTLPTPVAKMLNGLLDYRRQLKLPDGQVITPDPSVVIIGTMNPKSYLGTRQLAQDFNDRSKTMSWTYPPEKRESNGEQLYTPDEAAVLAAYVPCLEKLSLDEFTLLWDYVINDDKTNGGDRIIDSDKEEACKQLHLVLKAANKVREAYIAFQTGGSEAVSFVFSTRTAIYIAMDLKSGSNVNQVIKDVVVPKIADPQEQMLVGTILDGACLPAATTTGNETGTAGTGRMRALEPNDGDANANSGMFEADARVA
jgi:hypothetical protein